MNASAVRTWDQAHTRATVTVTCPDGHVAQLGGARAARCSYALIYQRAGGSYDVLGLRAQAVANRDGRHRYNVVPIKDATYLIEHALCATCGGFWPTDEAWEGCCGAPELDRERSAFAEWEGVTLVRQWEGPRRGDTLDTLSHWVTAP